MKDLKILDKDIDIAFEVKIISLIFYYLKNFYFFFKTIFITEKKYLKQIFKKIKLKKERINFDFY